MKILVSDSLSEAGCRGIGEGRLYGRGKTKLPKEELLKEIKDADGLIVRSRTKVTAELIAAASRLKVVSRAGSGLDNVDTPAATRRGIVVMNTPGGNTVTTAEHTIAMIFSMSPYSASDHFDQGREVGKKKSSWASSCITRYWGSSASDKSADTLPSSPRASACR